MEADTVEQPRTLDFRENFKTLKTHRKLILVITLLFTVAAATVSYSLPLVYEAEATLRVKQPNGLVSSLWLEPGRGSTTLLMATYAEILKSRGVVQEVINKTQASQEPLPTYANMVQRISTQPVKDTEILKIKATAKTPEEAQLVANTLTQVFQNRLMELARSEQTVVRKFIGDRLNQSKEELEKAELALQQYKTVNKITDTDVTTKTLVESLSSIKRLAADNAVNYAAAQGRLAYSKQQLADEKPSFIADNLLIQQHKGKLADLEVQLVMLEQKYTANHPSIAGIQAAIGETQRNLNQEISRVINSEASSINPIHQGFLQGRIMAEAELAAAYAQQQAISGIVRQSEQELGKLPVKVRELARAMRDVAVAQEVYVMLDKRYEEARIMEVMMPTDLQLIDAAALPEQPVGPMKVRNTIMGLVAGLVMGIILALLLDYFNRSIRTADDLKHYLELPVLGTIPHFDKGYQAPKPFVWQRFIPSAWGRSRKG